MFQRKRCSFLLGFVFVHHPVFNLRRLAARPVAIRAKLEHSHSEAPSGAGGQATSGVGGGAGGGGWKGATAEAGPVPRRPIPEQRYHAEYRGFGCFLYFTVAYRVPRCSTKNWKRILEDDIASPNASNLRSLQSYVKSLFSVSHYRISKQCITIYTHKQGKDRCSFSTN